MAFLHTQSCKCLKSELLRFDILPTQTMIQGLHWVQYKSTSSLTDDSPITFVMSGNGEEYIDIARTMLSSRVSLRCTTIEDVLPKGTEALMNRAEVAIMALKGEFSAHWVVAPVNSITNLSQEFRKQNKWLIHHHHGFDKILKDITRKVKKIYVRGKEK